MIILFVKLLWIRIITIINKFLGIILINLKIGIVKEIFELYIHKRKFYMFPIIILLIALIGVTALSQSGLVAFIYPI